MIVLLALLCGLPVLLLLFTTSGSEDAETEPELLMNESAEQEAHRQHIEDCVEFGWKW